MRCSVTYQLPHSERTGQAALRQDYWRHRRLPTDSHGCYLPILCIEIDMLYIECGQIEFTYQHPNSTLCWSYWRGLHEQSIYDCLEGYHDNFQRTKCICMYMWVMGMNMSTCLYVYMCACVFWYTFMNVNACVKAWSWQQGSSLIALLFIHRTQSSRIPISLPSQLTLGIPCFCLPITL